MAVAAASLALAAGEGVAAATWPTGFRAAEVYETPKAENVAVGDVTGDGRPDALVVNGPNFGRAGEYSVMVYAQRPDGTLGRSQTLPTHGTYPGMDEVDVGDLDGDGDLDAYVNTGYAYLQRGGALGGPERLPGETTGGIAVALADMDRDGLDDIVTSGARGLSVFRRTRQDARYRGGSVWPEGVRELEVGDLNADGRPDVAGYLSRSVYIYEQRSDGGYGARSIPLADRGETESVEVADVTGDGRDDIVAVGPEQDVHVLPQVAGRVSGVAATYQSYMYSEPVESADLNGDGRLDVATVDTHAHAGVFEQQPSGLLGPERVWPVPYATHYEERGLALGDLDCNGRVDMAIANYNYGLVVLRQPGGSPGSCPPPSGRAGTEGPGRLVVRLSARRFQSWASVRRRGVRVVLTCVPSCLATATVSVDRRVARRLGLRSRSLARLRVGVAGTEALAVRPSRGMPRRSPRLRRTPAVLVLRASLGSDSRVTTRRLVILRP